VLQGDVLMMLCSLSAAVAWLGPKLTAMQQQAPAAVPGVVQKRDPLLGLLQQQESLHAALKLVMTDTSVGSSSGNSSSSSIDNGKQHSSSSNSDSNCSNRWMDMFGRYAVPEEATALQLLPILKAAVSAELAQQLVDFGAALSGCFPAKLCCNAPSCSSLAGRSELEAVSGKSCMCGRCKAARWVCNARRYN
jgi:hypothetical protein